VDIHSDLKISNGVDLYFDMLNPNGNNFVDLKMFLRFYRIATIYL
jgi:hypothetical protein